MKRRIDSDPPVEKGMPRSVFKAKALFKEGIRVVNPLRLEQCFVCASSRELREASLRINEMLPWMKVTLLHPSRLGQARLSEEPFALLMDDNAARMFPKERFAGLHEGNRHTKSVLLSTDMLVGCSPPEAALASHPYTSKMDMIFYMGEQGFEPEEVVPAAVRCAEDRLNIDGFSQARRFIFLVVDDEPRWFSHFLPVLYKMIGQRAAILTARSYDEAHDHVERFGEDIVCLVSDVHIPKGGARGPNGKLLIEEVRSRFKRIPIIVASGGNDSSAFEGRGLFVMPKKDPSAAAKLEGYVRDFTGLGDFFVYKDGYVLGRASNLRELRDLVFDLDCEILDVYAERDYFSTWLYMHGFRELADNLRPRSDRGEGLRDILLETLEEEMLRMEETPIRFLKGRKMVAKAIDLPTLAKAVGEVDIQTLEFYAHADAISTWLMRKGHSALADRLRPIQATGEELRQRILSEIREELAQWR